MSDVRVDEKGTVWVGDGAVVFYGPFTDEERTTLSQRVYRALIGLPQLPEDPRTYKCRIGQHRLCSGYWGHNGDALHGPCECDCHEGGIE